MAAAAGCVLTPCPALSRAYLNNQASSIKFKSNLSPLNHIIAFSKSLNTTTTTIYSNVKSQQQQHTHRDDDDDMWEDPQDGSHSDEDDSEEEDEEWVEDSAAAAAFVDDDDSETERANSLTSTISDSEIRFIQEVDQLLTPEERKILEENEAPVITKISTAKWGLLQTLALTQQIPFMDKMLVQGIPIDDSDKDGLTALHKAIIGKREAVISHLLRKGANPHVRDKDGVTPLHYAVQVGAVQTVKLLIKYKVDVNAEDNDGWTPLHVAIQSRCRDIAKVLLVNGADKTRRTKDGTSILDLSLCYGKDFKSYDLVKLVKLVPAGIDP